MGFEESLNLSQKILAWIAEYEPIESMRELEKSGLSKEKPELNIYRLRDANLINANFFATAVGQDIFDNIKLTITYEGLKELAGVMQKSKIVKNSLIQIGKLEFTLSVDKIFGVF